MNPLHARHRLHAACSPAPRSHIRHGVLAEQGRAAPPKGGEEQASEARRLPADVTTDQTVELPTERCASRRPPARSRSTTPKASGKPRRLHRLQRPDIDAAARPPHLRVHGGPGASSAYLQLGAMGRGGCRRQQHAFVDADCSSQSGDVARLPISWSSIRSHRLQPLSSRARRGAQQFWSVGGDMMCSRPSCASGSRERTPGLRRNSSRGRAMAVSAREARIQAE